MKILNRLPYSTEAATETVGDEAVRIKPYQIVVHISIGLLTLPGWDPRMPHFPVILDTGNNHNLAIRHDHLVRWAGLRPEALRVLGAMRERHQRLPLHAAAVWLHRNKPGAREPRDDAEPHPLNMLEGITVYPDDIGPRLPILGLRALTRNRLHLAVDADRREVSLRTPDWVTFVIRRLRGFR